uniref:DNA/RNA-binding protein Alba-like domain-containing protein n=1 Tax=Oreochromis aureus TaxID=47969 RepID=A0A668S2I0_OREAU
MENYSKARTVEQPCVCPFPDLAPDTPEIHVKDGSKIRNLLRYALSRMEAKARAVIFTAAGRRLKAITCAEIVKRRVKGCTSSPSSCTAPWRRCGSRWSHRRLDSLTVSRNLPVIWILLSKDPLDSNQPGYQAPGRYDALSLCSQRGASTLAPRQRVAVRVTRERSDT